MPIVRWVIEIKDREMHGALFSRIDVALTLMHVRGQRPGNTEKSRILGHKWLARECHHSRERVGRPLPYSETMLRIQCLTIDSRDPHALAAFWSQALSWPLTDEGDNEVFIECPAEPGTVPYPDILFLRVDDAKSNKNRLHLDLRPDDQAAEVARLESLGATRIEIGQSAEPDATWVVMADPEGNEFCVLRAITPE